jgi:hypothetical protein
VSLPASRVLKTQIMKIETLTPKIAALHLGQQCNVIYNAQIIGPSIRKIDCDVIHWLESGSIEILPHLRRMDSLTEAEARELYEIKYGEAWGVDFERLGMEVESCLERFWKEDIELYAPEGKLLIGSPAVWLHLLSLGFDLFGLIDAGLAKEITNP